MQRLSTDISTVGENFNQLYNVYNFTSGGRGTMVAEGCHSEKKTNNKHTKKSSVF